MVYSFMVYYYSLTWAVKSAGYRGISKQIYGGEKWIRKI